MITSTGNNHVRAVSSLVKKAKARREQGLFIVEGAKMFSELPKEKLKETYVSESFLRQHGEKAELLKGIHYEEVSDDVMKYMSDTQTPQGILAGVVMNSATADIYNPKVIRSTMGSIYRVPFVYVDDLGKALVLIKSKGIRLYAAHLKGTGNYEDEDYRKDTGFLIGNEANGLTEETAAMADCYVKIPMAGTVESLNAAVAASVLMFEAARQRRN